MLVSEFPPPLATGITWSKCSLSEEPHLTHLPSSLEKTSSLTSSGIAILLIPTASEYLPESSLPSFNRPIFLTFIKKPPTVSSCLRQRTKATPQDHFDGKLATFIDRILHGLFGRRSLVTEIGERGNRIIAHCIR